MHKVLKLRQVEQAPADPAPTGMDRAVKPRRFRPATLALAAVILLAAGAGVFAYVKFGLVRSVSVSAERLAISQVRKGLFRDYVPVTGAIAPRDTVYLDAVEGGHVDAVLVEEGAMVRAGQPWCVQQPSPGAGRDRPSGPVHRTAELRRQSAAGFQPERTAARPRD